MTIRFEFPDIKGESIIVYTEDYLLLIDGGYKGTSKKLEKSLTNLKRDIDLVILTHTDRDHIGGLINLIKSPRRPAIRELWFNTSDKVKLKLSLSNDMLTSYSDGNTFFKLIQEKGGDISYKSHITNQSFRNGYRATGDLNIDILLPTQEILDRFYREWNQKVFDSVDMTVNSDGGDWDESIKKLRDEELGKDTSTPNKASIANLLTYKSKKFLLSGDAYADDIFKSLRIRGYSESSPIETELFQIPHHGSSNNISVNLLNIVKTKNYLICCSGLNNKHLPHKKTIAYLLHSKDDSSNIISTRNLDGLFLSPEEEHLKSQIHVKSSIEF